ncbi:MAG: diaminopimelate decarboxylase [Gammaproteobacteria bacterium]|nr:diaminopimelate decarboxylase [Gammaproteobacteria bacterium]
MKTVKNKFLINAAEQFGTPVFLYDVDIIKERYYHVRGNLPSNCDIFYSLKANPAIAICEQLRKLGAQCEVSSKNELMTALKSGFKPEQIIFVGPAKKQDEIALCIQKKIRHIVCESVEEITLVNFIAEKNKTKTSILVRLNPDFTVKKSPIKMSGVASQFGIDVKQFISKFKKIQRCSFVSLDGIHIYNASRVLDGDAIIENIKNILSLVKTLSIKLKIKFNVIDLGGGFGIPYFTGESELNHASLISEINGILNDHRKLNSTVIFILELGRYLVADSGYLISTVQYVKTSHDKNYLIVDAGMNCFMAATGLGSYVHRNFHFSHIPISNSRVEVQKKQYQVAGPLCTPGDVLLKNVELSNVSRGDLIVFEKTGAYGLTASPSRFLSHGSPAEAIYDDKKNHLIRRRETIDDIFSTQNSLNTSEWVQQSMSYSTETRPVNSSETRPAGCVQTLL